MDRLASGSYVPHVRVEQPVGGEPEVVIGYNIRLHDPHSVRMLIDLLHEVLDNHTIHNRWVQP